MLQWESLLQDSRKNCRRGKVCKNCLLHQERTFQAGMSHLAIFLLGRYIVVLGGKGCLNPML